MSPKGSALGTLIALIAGEMQRVDHSHGPIETSAGEARAQKTVATQHNEICCCFARASGRAKQHTEAGIVARRHPIKIDHQIDTRIGVGELHQRAMPRSISPRTCKTWVEPTITCRTLSSMAVTLVGQHRLAERGQPLGYGGSRTIVE